MYDIFVDGHLMTRFKASCLESARYRARLMYKEGLLQVAERGKLMPGYDKPYAKYAQVTLHPDLIEVSEGKRIECPSL